MMKALIRNEGETITEDMGVPCIDWLNGWPLTDPAWAGGPYRLVQNYVAPTEDEPGSYDLVEPEIVEEAAPAPEIEDDTIEINGVKYTKEQLREVLMYTAEKVTEWAPEVTLDSEGHTVLPEGLSDRARAAMEKLSQEYGPLRSYYPPLKPVMLSELMCYGHITGVFSFFSMESNYNQNDVPENRGFIFCHELSHMTGFMREDEANFISYLACTGSGDSYLAFSAYYNALIYLLNAYYPEASGDEYGQALAAIPQSTLKQLVMENEFWDKYKTDFGEVAEAMNDVYLKVNDQSDGTKSYGRVVDLLIADYYAKKG